MAGNIYSKIDALWEELRVAEDFDSLAIFDLFSIIIFLKHHNELGHFEEGHPAPPQHGLQTPSNEMEKESLLWKNLVTANPQQLYDTFSSGAVARLLKEQKTDVRAKTRFIENAGVNIPAPETLSKAVQLVDELDPALPNGEEDFYTYLLTKAKYERKNKQYIVPQHIAALVAELASPKQIDIIFDPSAGRCELLLACADYINESDSNGRMPSTKKMIGIDEDPAFARLGAIALSLKSPEHQELRSGNILENVSLFSEEASLVVCNLLFTEPFYEGSLDQNELDIETKKRELLYLKLVLRRLKNHGRAVVLVPENFLKEHGSLLENEIKSEVAERCQLDAVISLPPNTITGLAKTAAVVVFTKMQPDTEHQVFFYNLQTDGVSAGNEKTTMRRLASGPLMFPEDFGDIPDLLNRWKACRNNEECENTSKSLLVPIREIRKKNYSFNLKSYMTAKSQPAPKILNQNVFQQRERITTKQKKKRIIPAAALLLLLIAAGAFFFLRNGNAETRIAAGTASFEQANGNMDAGENSKPKKQKDTLIRISPAPHEIPPKKTPGTTAPVPNATAEKKNTEGTEKKQPAETTITRTSVDANAAKGEYKIINKAYFHNEPDENTRRNAFVVHWNNSYATLKALDEKDGFIYVVFKNHLGQVSKGWLKKEDLRKINENNK